MAQLLIEINPAAANEIMLRARTFAENRLVCGHHYKSDIDAGMMLAMSVVSTLHGNDAFQAQAEVVGEELAVEAKSYEKPPFPGDVEANVEAIGYNVI